MANVTGVSGATIVELLGDGGNPIQFTKDTSSAITKGDVLEMTDPRSVSAPDSASAAIVFAGIAAEDVTAAEARDHISCYTYGVFDMHNADTAGTAGQAVQISGGNLVGCITAVDNSTSLNAGHIIGKALETPAADEQFEVLVGPR